LIYLTIISLDPYSTPLKSLIVASNYSYSPPFFHFIINTIIFMQYSYSDIFYISL